MASNKLDQLATVSTIVVCFIIGFSVLRRDATKPPVFGKDAVTTDMPGQWAALANHGIRIQGSASSPIQILEFSDLECPFCRRLHETLAGLPALAHDSVSVVFIHYPLEIHRFARVAALAAECAEHEGLFGTFVNRVFQLQDSLGLKDWTIVAKEAGVADTLAFLRCLKGPEHPRIAEGRRVGDSIGVHGTPTVIVNGIRFGGTPNRSQLDSAISASLRKNRNVQ